MGQRGSVLQGRWQNIWPMLLLCVLSGSRWLAADAWPATGSTIASEAVAGGVCGLIAAALMLRYREAGVRHHAWFAAAAGVGLLVAPVASAVLRGAAGEPFMRAASMGFVPFALAIILAARPSTEGGLRLGPPLAAVGGMLLLFPLTLPDSVAGYVSLIASPLVVAAGLALWREPIRKPWTTAAVFFASGTAGLGLLAFQSRLHNPEVMPPLHALAVLLDVLMAALMMLTLVRAGARRFPILFLAVPLLTTLEGVVIFRPAFSLRIISGLVLLTAAVIALWREPAATEPPMSVVRS